MANNPEEPPPGVIGLPPSARGLSPIPADPSEHAVRSAREWEDVVEAYVQERMHELGVPEEKIGAIDFLHGKGRRAFVPQEQKGGTVDEFGRIFVDSGFLNPDLVDPFGPEASAAWKDSPARHRIDAGTISKRPLSRGDPWTIRVEACAIVGVIPRPAATERVSHVHDPPAYRQRLRRPLRPIRRRYQDGRRSRPISPIALP